MLLCFCNLSPIDTRLVITENDSTNHGLKLKSHWYKVHHFVVILSFNSKFHFQNLTQIHAPFEKMKRPQAFIRNNTVATSISTVLYGTGTMT